MRLIRVVILPLGVLKTGFGGVVGCEEDANLWLVDMSVADSGGVTGLKPVSQLWMALMGMAVWLFCCKAGRPCPLFHPERLRNY